MSTQTFDCAGCGKTVVKDHGSSILCNDCYCVWMSDRLSGNGEKSHEMKSVRGFSARKVRFIRKQLEKRSCRECGAPLHINFYVLEPNAQLLSVRCDDPMSHDALALVLKSGRVLEIYDSGVWQDVGIASDYFDIPF